MTETLTINTSGKVVLSEDQSKAFALSILADIKNYVKEHQAEYEQWLIEQKEGKTNAV